jgi:hypothetical protein
MSTLRLRATSEVPRAMQDMDKKMCVTKILERRNLCQI